MYWSTLLLALSGLVAASELTGRIPVKGAQANLLLPGGNSKALTFSLGCSAIQKECDSFCIPTGGICCNDGDGAYCDAGTYCMSTGCCETGEVCSGPPTGCNDGKKLCGDKCIPEDGVCCGSSGTYCDKGNVCTSDGFCEKGSSTDSDSDDDDGGVCLSFQEECGGLCMPKGSVCCNSSGYYCDKGETCESGGLCKTADGSDTDSSSSTEDDDSDATPTSTDSVPVPSLDLGLGDDDSSPNLCKRKGRKVSTGGGGGDDDADAAEDDSSSDGGDGCGASLAAGGLTIPTVLMGVAAVFALALA